MRNLRLNGFKMGNVAMEDPLFELGYKDFNPVSVDSDDVERLFLFEIVGQVRADAEGGLGAIPELPADGDRAFGIEAVAENQDFVGRVDAKGFVVGENF